MSGRISRKDAEHRRQRRLLSTLERRKEYGLDNPLTYQQLECKDCKLLYGTHRRITKHRVPITQGASQCLQCGRRASHDGTPANYFWVELNSRCKACHASLEQNNKETIAYCWTADCPAHTLQAPKDKRCSRCGSSGLRAIGGIDRHYHCDDCGANMTYLIRSVC